MSWNKHGHPSDPCKVRSLRFHLKAISSKAWEMQSQLYPACSGVPVSVEVKALHFVLLEDMILIWVGVRVNSTVMLQKWACGLVSQHFQQFCYNFWIYFRKGPYICRVNQLHPGQVIKLREETLLWFQTSSLFLPKRNKHLFWVSRRGQLFLLRKYTFLLKAGTHFFFLQVSLKIILHHCPLQSPVCITTTNSEEVPTCCVSLYPFTMLLKILFNLK